MQGVLIPVQSFVVLLIVIQKRIVPRVMSGQFVSAIRSFCFWGGEHEILFTMTATDEGDGLAYFFGRRYGDLSLTESNRAVKVLLLLAIGYRLINALCSKLERCVFHLLRRITVRSTLQVRSALSCWGLV